MDTTKIPIVPIIVLAVLVIAGASYVPKKLGERRTNKDAVRRHSLKACDSWETCVNRVAERFDYCFSTAYEMSLRPGRDVLDLEGYVECVNMQSIMHEEVFELVPGQVPFPAR